MDVDHAAREAARRSRTRRRDFSENGAADALGLAVKEVARALRDLGNADAATPMGAIEAHGVVVKEAAETSARAIEAHGRAVGEAAETSARAVKEAAAIIADAISDLAAAIREANHVERTSVDECSPGGRG